MFTVILYRDGEDISLEEYRSVFFSSQEDGKISLCPWKTDSKISDLVEDLNLLTEMRREWRLLIFDGTNQLCDEDERSIAGSDIGKLIKEYSGQGRIKSSDFQKLSFPDQIWYVFWSSKYVHEKKNHGTIKSVGEWGSGVRFLWVELDMSCELDKQYSLFCLNCVLLTLATNHNYPGILEKGYLYKTEIEINRGRFAECVRRQEGKLKEIEKQIYDEELMLSRQKKHGKPFPEWEQVSFQIWEEEERPKVVSSSALRDIAKLETTLTQNRMVVHSNLHFSKELIRDQIEPLKKTVEETEEEVFLNNRARDTLQRKKREILERISGMKRIPMKYEEFDERFRKYEEELLWQARGKMEWKMKTGILLLLSVAQWGILWFLLAREPRVRLFVDDRAAGGLLFCLTVVLVFVFSFLLTSLSDRHKIRKYRVLLQTETTGRGRKDRIRYMEKMLAYISEYQFYLRTEKEQERLERTWRERWRILSHHKRVCEDSIAACQRLKAFFSEDEYKETVYPPPTVDFKQEPQDIEYYWLPFKKGKRRVPLNNTGETVDVFFDFVTKLTIRKTPWGDTDGWG